MLHSLKEAAPNTIASQLNKISLRVLLNFCIDLSFVRYFVLLFLADVV